MLGCDGPAKKEHVFVIDGKEYRTRRCPRKEMAAGKKYFRIYNWADKGRLDYLYKPGETPSKVIEAIDFIDGLLAKTAREARNGS